MREQRLLNDAETARAKYGVERRKRGCKTKLLDHGGRGISKGLRDLYETQGGLSGALNWALMYTKAREHTTELRPRRGEKKWLYSTSSTHNWHGKPIIGERRRGLHE